MSPRVVGSTVGAAFRAAERAELAWEAACCCAAYKCNCRLRRVPHDDRF